ncbi:MAG: hypothetical protein U1E29_08495, partial [Coriobacteriia bacterium]|nr:hypothetical protein [Coriobacteriia bacterium]
ISAAQSDFPASDNWAREANRRMPGSAAPALRARLSARLGDLRLRENQAEKAAEVWEREASFWRDARYAPGVSDALLRAAEAWRQAGRMDAAAVDFLRAARSLAAQDRPEEAALAARQGLELSNEPGSPEVLRSLRELIP